MRLPPVAQKVAILVFIASIFFSAAYVFDSFDAFHSKETKTLAFSTWGLMFYWLSTMFIGVGSMTIPFTIRYFIPGIPLSGAPGLLAALFGYGAYTIVSAIPSEFLTGSLPSGTSYFVLSCICKILAGLLLYAAGYIVISHRDDEIATESLSPVDDATQCLASLGNFINLTRANIGTDYTVERLWRPVYAYLDNKQMIHEIVVSGRANHYEIVLNAVGSMAFKLLASGDFHEARGLLNMEGEYIHAVWIQAAHELMTCSRSTPEDLTRGMMALDQAIESAG